MSKKQSEVRLRLASAVLLEGGTLELYISPQKLARFTAWRIIASSAHHSAEYTPLAPDQSVGRASPTWVGLRRSKRVSRQAEGDFQDGLYFCFYFL